MSAVGPRNLARLAEETFERRGDYPALWFERVWHTSGDLFARGERIAAGLAERGVAAGDRVVVMMENCPDVPVVYHAIWRAGGVVTPAIFLLTVEELGRLIADARPALVLTTPTFREVADEAAKGVRVISDLGPLEREEHLPIVARGDDDLAALVYTGGTTGRAKGVMLTHANLWEAGRRGHEAGHVPGLDRSLGCLPLAHSYGLLVLNVGMHHPDRPQGVLMRWFEPQAWLELAQEHRSQIAPVVPSMLYMLLAQPLEDYDLSELRYVACGAAPLALGAIEEFLRRVPGVEIREGYGLTETSALVSTNPPGRPKYGTVGPPVPRTEVQIVDGEICVRSDLVMAGYWNEPDLTRETIRDGWLYTGDMGRLDDDGYLTIVDRKKDLIIRGGFNVFPRDVEEALLEHPAIATACVVGRPDDVHGEEVVAFVTLIEEIAAEELVAFGRERLGGYKYPREIHVVDALPLTPVGKADRKALRELLTVQGGTTA
ncbi:MAG: AMP-binding protein [Actinomycetota bacterium]|nr:AMP-binding protein [Actinomycetota bacterium]